ncbi:MAG: cation:proton antiporter [Candidatus Bathyarchaeia archaeon]
MIEPPRLLLLFSSMIVLSYFSSLIYRRTKVPDLVWLMGFGVLLGPMLGILDEEIFVVIAPLMGVVSINIITFGAGIDTDIANLRDVIPKSAALTLSTFTAVTMVVGLVSSLMVPELDFIRGLLLGTMLSGISTVAIISMMDELKKIISGLESIREILVLESTIVDPVRIILALTIINMILQKDIEPLSSLKIIYATFALASIFGVVLGVLWALILHRLRYRHYNYMLTLAFLFSAYYLGENLAGQGGGTMTSYTIGLVLANHQYFTRQLGFKLRFDIGRIREFNSEISFVMKSYYFVYIGIIVTLSREYMMVGLALTTLIILTRYTVASIVGYVENFTSIETLVARYSFPLGTSALVFSQLPIIYDPQQKAITNPHIYTNLVFPVVLGTIIFMTLSGPTIVKWRVEQGEAE